MAATVRLGTCSFADEGLLKHWYPKGVSTSKARLAYYAERFDTVEVDSPFYHLPDPEVTGRWAQRTPPEFVFHVKAHGSMTGHVEAEQEQAFAEFRASLEPLELSGKLRTHPAPVPPALQEVGGGEGGADARSAAARPARAARRVPPPLLARGGRAQRTRSRFLEEQRARVRVGRRAAHARLERAPAGRRRDASASRTSASTAAT